MGNILTTLTSKQAKAFGPGRTAFTEILLHDDGSGTIVPVTWEQFDSRVTDIAKALNAKGVAPGDTIAIFSPNSPEILVTDFAAYRNRAIPVAIYATSSPEQVAYIVNDCGARIILAGDQRQYDVIRSCIHDMQGLEMIILGSDDIRVADDDSISVTFKSLLEQGHKLGADVAARVEMTAAQALPEDIATLVYTSGTTGEPKGAILPHSCFNVQLDAHRARLTMLSPDDTSVAFLPMSHIFEKAWTYFCLSMGMVVHVNRDPRRVQEALKVARPTCMCSVPRFWEKVYAAVQEKIAATHGIAGWLMQRAIKVGAKRNLDYKRLGIPVPAWLELKYRFYDRVVFSKVRAAIGIDRPNIFPTAGAPLSASIVEFLHSIGINIVIGYGLSETTATVACFPLIGFEIGSVGTVLDDIQVRIGPRNEILVKGPTVMRGYYGRPEDTARAFTPDGWFRTGDAGIFDQNGALILTERLKDLFKTSNGKYIAPQAIEARLGEDKYIEQVAVIGDRRKYVTAIIVPGFEALKEYARSKDIRFDSIEDLVKNSEIRKFIGERIERLQKGFAGFEKIKKFTLMPREFTIESGELTNTLKIRRPVINSVYASEIEAMYV